MQDQIGKEREPLIRPGSQKTYDEPLFTEERANLSVDLGFGTTVSFDHPAVSRPNLAHAYPQRIGVTLTALPATLSAESSQIVRKTPQALQLDYFADPDTLAEFLATKRQYLTLLEALKAGKKPEFLAVKEKAKEHFPDLLIVVNEWMTSNLFWTALEPSHQPPHQVLTHDEHMFTEATSQTTECHRNSLMDFIQMGEKGLEFSRTLINSGNETLIHLGIVYSVAGKGIKGAGSIQEELSKLSIDPNVDKYIRHLAFEWLYPEYQRGLFGARRVLREQRKKQ